MSCPSEERLSDLVDGLGTPEDERHVESCSGCSEIVDSLEALGLGLRGLPLAREKAAPSLRATLKGLAAGASTDATEKKGRKARGLATALAAMAAAAAMVLAPETGTFSTALAEDAVSHHLRAFAQGDGSGCDVLSDDPAELSHWLTNTLGREVEVPVLEGARLIGARRCSLLGERAGAVVYRTERGAVTLFLPSPGGTAEAACERSPGCTDGKDGQTVCVIRGAAGVPGVLVGEAPPDQLCALAGI